MREEDLLVVEVVVAGVKGGNMINKRTYIYTQPTQIVDEASFFLEQQILESTL